MPGDDKLPFRARIIERWRAIIIAISVELRRRDLGYDSWIAILDYPEVSSPDELGYGSPDEDGSGDEE